MLRTASEFRRDVEALCTTTWWEKHQKSDVYGKVVTWMEATYALQSVLPEADTHIVLTVYVYFNEDYRVPQLGFHSVDFSASEEMVTFLHGISFLNCSSEGLSSDPVEAHGPLASFSWSEELQRYLWQLHACDTARVLRHSASYRRTRSEGPVSIFLDAMSYYFPLHPMLRTPA